MKTFLTEGLIYIYWGIFVLVHLAGLIVAIILLRKAKGTPAILAAVAFGLLFLQDVGRIIRRPHRLGLDSIIYRLTSASGGIWEVGNCCCGILEIAALVCLVIAIWQAVAGPGGGASDS